jgi:hypothetical protein
MFALLALRGAFIETAFAVIARGKINNFFTNLILREM